MLKKIIYFCLSILLIFTFSIKITSSTTNIKNLQIIKNHKDLLYNINTNKNNTDILGTITINKINLKNNLYNINDTRNNIEENVTILKESVMPDKDNSIIFLAAHSGTGRIAYFERLNELKINDIIKLKLKNKTYYYKIIEIFEKDKDGFIDISKTKENQLVLTTCSPSKKNKQLIINSTEKSS